MKSRITGFVFYCLAAVVTVYALALLVPVWVGWYRSMAAAFIASMTNALNSLAAYQLENPAEMGMVALLVAVVLFLFGWICMKISQHERDSRSASPGEQTARSGFTAG